MIAVLFTVAKNWKWPKCQLLEQMNCGIFIDGIPYSNENKLSGPNKNNIDVQYKHNTEQKKYSEYTQWFQFYKNSRNYIGLGIYTHTKVAELFRKKTKEVMKVRITGGRGEGGKGLLGAKKTFGMMGMSIRLCWLFHRYISELTKLYVYFEYV